MKISEADSEIKYGSHLNTLQIPIANMGSCTNLTFAFNDCTSQSLHVPEALNISNQNSSSLLIPPIMLGEAYISEELTIIDTDLAVPDESIQNNMNCNEIKPHIKEESPTKSQHSPESDDKDMSDILSALSNEECSLTSDLLDRKNSKTSEEDPNEHICHIDSPETSDTTCMNSETIHGESMIDDIGSVLGQDLIMAMLDKNGDFESTFTDETTIFTSDTASEIPLDSRNPSLEKYDERIFNFLHRARKSSKDSKEKFGYENKVFDLAVTGDQPVKYCSLAQFVEGNDIARRSFKKHLKRSIKLEKTESNITRETILNEENESIETLKNEMKESCSNLSNIDIETVISNKEIEIQLNDVKDTEFNNDLCKIGIQRENESGANDKMENLSESNKHTEIFNLDVNQPGCRMFPRVSVVVEPPSPSGSEGKRGNGTGSLLGLGGGLMPGLAGGLGPPWARERRCSDNGPRTSLDVERCPSATRRISCGSLFQPGEADR